MEYARGAATIKGIEEFWAYARMRLLRTHRVADDHFLMYLKDVENRINLRNLERQAFVSHPLNKVLLA